MTFAQPSAPNMGDKFEAHQHQGSLLIVYPKRFEENIKTTKGLSDAADADIIVVDKVGPDGRPLVFHGARLFGNLARSVRNDLGGQVLGRLNQITSANGNTPWILENFTEQDAMAAGPADAAYRAGQFRPAQNPMASPAAAPPAYGGAPAQQSWQGAAPAAPQAYGATASPAPQQQQWNAQPTAPAHATQQAPPAYNAAPSPAPAAPQQQWNQPPPTAPAAPYQAPAPAAAAGGASPSVDPAVLAKLAQFGITPPPDADPAQIMSIYATLPQ